MIGCELMVMEVERVQLKNGESLPMLLDEQGLPITPVNEWILSRRHRAFNTLSNDLQDLIPLYLFFASKGVDLFELIRSGRYWTETFVSSLGEALRRPLTKNKKVTRLAVRPGTVNKRISTSLRYLNWCFNVVLSRDDVTKEHRAEIGGIKEKVNESLNNARPSLEPLCRAQKKGLNGKQARYLQDALEPISSTLFSCRLVRLRNYLIVIILMFYGLRPGELLSLRLDDVELGALASLHVRRRRPSAEDSRSRPASIKRAGRILVLDNPRLAMLLNEYAMGDRERAVSRKKGRATTFFFLSRDGQPLSMSSVQDIFIKARRAYPDKLPGHLCAKSMRHTFTDGVYKELQQQGHNEDEIRGILMYLRGDTSPESQDTYIDYQRQGHDALRNYRMRVAGKGVAEDVPF